MAQSSDRNDFKRNNGDGSTQAEQILDSIIEHIETTDGSVTDEDQKIFEVAQSEEVQIDATQSLDDQHEQQQSAHDAISDFKNIEKRAAALASKLGGAGLSYNAGIKKHLEQIPEPDEQNEERVVPIIEAVIHQDDLDVDSERFGISFLDEPESGDQEPQELGGADAILQHEHVSEWNAELQEDDGIAVEPALEVELLEVDLNVPDAQIETVRFPLVVKEENPVDQPEPIEPIVETCGPVDIDPELQNIEKNIEALSSSMSIEQVAPVVQNFIDTQDPIDENLAVPIIPFEGMESRITTLEANIVKLLDDVSLSEQKLGDTVREIVRSQTQEAVRESLEISDVFSSMKAELAQAAEQRHLQDVRMSDSLDALHDTLKDIGDRVKIMEAGRAVRPQSVEMNIPTSVGIVSSVLGTSIGDSQLEVPLENIHSESQVTTEVCETGSPELHDDLPAWLSDATQDLREDQHDTPIESADVFAPDLVQLEVLSDKDVDGDISSVLTKAAPPIEAEKTNILPASGLSEDELQPDEKGGQPIVEQEYERENVDQSGIRKQPAELESKTRVSNDFLRSARAAARAANERARESEQPDKSADVKSKTIANIGNFIEAAKQKEADVEAEPIVDKVKPGPKNSLFTDKVRGPNSWLVFTSLMLFGTSALLLYGMSRGNIDTGSVVKLNAMVRTAAQQPVVAGNELEISSMNKTIDKQKAFRVEGGKRPKLEKNIAVSSVKQILANKGSDTLTGLDKIKSSRLVVLTQEPEAIRHTSSTNRANGTVETGSLFDQYISFSEPSSASGRESSKISGADTSLKTRTKIDGVAGLLSSASGGNAQAQYEVARRFGQGIGVRKSPAISVEWYEKSAKAGYAPAIYRLATMYERGKGVAKDYKRAMTLYLSAAEKGNVKAMHNLAVLYTGGNLGKTDYTNAITWYHKAAQYGVKDSQFNLAIIYQNGMGGKLDLEQAYKWYFLAARSGDREAKGLLKDLRRDLSSSKQKNLDKKLSDWKPKTPDKSANVVRQYRKASLSALAGTKT